ncbi:serpin family protein [Gloeobacter violaceus]|uniref:Glr1970 protein n=1 Tax=Gloeobacter violaceus (strain ATCC 29082 / PCC 7421) TaxID=251221 RepID=Q7NJ62_GLOVI|nr:serpin family protein [Gloeobacter violaceus]BAC89911.1 glr1970 [Gloeobacter violaceus PCC 7421]
MKNDAPGRPFRRSTLLRWGLALALFGSGVLRAGAQEKSAVKMLSDAQTRFGLQLFAALHNKAADQNVVISPLSIALALTMAYNGAGGSTRTAMAQTLALDGLDEDAINQGSADLATALQKTPKTSRVLIANSLWSQKGITLQPAFIRTAEQYFQAQVEALNFAEPRSAERINRWVAEKTENKIDQIVSPGALRDALVVLMNAVYFKADWQEAFEKSATRERPFKLGSGWQKNHPLMAKQGRFDYYETDEFQAVRLPYKDDFLGMYVFLPKADPAAFYRQLTAENWQQWLGPRTFARRPGELVLPRFQVRYEAQLKQTLSALGMGIAFTGRADFTRMVREPALISEVIHKTFVDVNEEGTEAAAATGVIVARTSAVATPPFRMVVDRPFFFAIQDNRTGTLLFAGAIADPMG